MCDRDGKSRAGTSAGGARGAGGKCVGAEHGSLFGAGGWTEVDCLGRVSSSNASKQAGFIATSREGGLERDLGGRGEVTGGGEGPSREKIPGVEDLETWWKLRGDTAAEGNIR